MRFAAMRIRHFQEPSEARANEPQKQSASLSIDYPVLNINRRFLENSVARQAQYTFNLLTRKPPLVHETSYPTRLPCTRGRWAAVYPIASSSDTRNINVSPRSFRILPSPCKGKNDSTRPLENKSVSSTAGKASCALPSSPGMGSQFCGRSSLLPACIPALALSSYAVMAIIDLCAGTHLTYLFPRRPFCSLISFPTLNFSVSGIKMGSRYIAARRSSTSRTRIWTGS